MEIQLDSITELIQLSDPTGHGPTPSTKRLHLCESDEKPKGIEKVRASSKDTS